MKKSLSLVLSIVCILSFVLLATASNKKETVRLDEPAEPVETVTVSVKETTEATVFHTEMKREDGYANPDYQDVVEEAVLYIKYQPFSRLGLIDQLVYEGFSAQEAEYAVDNCGANWNEQAFKSARNTVTYSSISYEGLKRQLVFEKYTDTEVSFALQKCNADWNAEAAEAAAKYIEYLDFSSREEIVRQLENDGFTNEQAVYGAQQNGY